MNKLKLSAPADDKPVKLTIELPAQVHRDLVAYAEVLSRDIAQVIEPAKLVAPMLARFMTTARICKSSSSWIKHKSTGLTNDIRL